MSVLIYTIITLTALGLLAAVVIYFVSKKFAVQEDPRIEKVEAVLPATNCGGCGQPPRPTPPYSCFLAGWLSSPT